MATPSPAPKPMPVSKRQAPPVVEDMVTLRSELLTYWKQLPEKDVGPLRSLLIQEVAFATSTSVVYTLAALRITRNSLPRWRYSCSTMASLLGLLTGSMLGLVSVSEQGWHRIGATGAGQILTPYWLRYGGKRHQRSA